MIRSKRTKPLSILLQFDLEERTFKTSLGGMPVALAVFALLTTGDCFSGLKEEDHKN